jgi:HEAT repeat protein
MSSTGKWQKNLICLAAAGLSLLLSQNSLIGKSYSPAAPAVLLSAVNDRQNKEFEESLKALNAENSDERHRAAIALGKFANPRAVEPLIKALSDPDSFVRSFAAVSLGNLKDPRALEPLIKLLGDENKRVRRSAAEALGSMRNRSALDALVKALNDGDVFVRRSAAQALGNLGDPNAIDPLLKALGDEDSYIWTGASIALTEIGSAGIPKLVSALGDRTLGPRVVEILKNLNWQPATEAEKIRFDDAIAREKKQDKD